MKITHFYTKKSAIAVITVIAALCIIVAGSFAWFYFAAGFTNEFVYEPSQIKLIKYEEGTKKTVAGAVFHLYAEDKPDTVIGVFTTDKKGEIAINGLEVGKKYFFKEVSAPYGYSILDKDKRYEFTVEHNTEKLLEAYNRCNMGKLTINKTIASIDINGDPYILSQEEAAFEFEFTVYIGTDSTAEYEYIIKNEADAEISRGKIRSGSTISLKNGETAYFENVPMGAYYEVKEKNYLDTSLDNEVIKDAAANANGGFGCENPGKGHETQIGVLKGFMQSGDGTVGNIKADGSKAVFVNTKVTDNYPITISSLAIVDRIITDGSNDIDFAKAFEVTAVVGINPDQQFWYEVIHPGYIRDYVPDYDYDYPYYERNDPGEPSVSISESGSISDKPTLKSNKPDTPTISVWTKNSPFHKPLAIERWKQEDGTVPPPEKSLMKSNSNTITAQLHHGSALVIYGVPVGTTYTVEQKDYRNIDGYIIADTKKTVGTILKDLDVLEDNETTDTKLMRVRADIYNILQKSADIELSVEKKWNNGSNSILPKNLVVDVIDKKTQIIYANITLIPANNWKAVIKVPRYDADGNEIVYDIVEKNIPSGYQLSSKEKLDNSFVLTNSYSPSSVKPQVTKNINGSANRYDAFRFKITPVTPNAPMPSSDIVTIYGEGTAFFENIEFTQTGKEGIRKYEYQINEIKDGKSNYTYDYSVYTMTVTVNESKNSCVAYAVYAKNGSGVSLPLVFTNSYRTFSSNGNLTISKAVQGNSEDKKQEFDFTVIIGYTKHSIKLADGESYTFSSIPVGTQYQVTENAADGFSTVAQGVTTGNMSVGGVDLKFTNTRENINKNNLQSLKVTKTIEGKYVDTAKRFRFTVRIGSDVYQFALGHGESQTFDKIPEGQFYSVSEEDCTKDGYVTTSINASGTMPPKGVTAEFTNTYQGEIPSMPLSGFVLVKGGKAWVHGNNPVENRPSSITVYVMNGSNIAAKKVVGAKDQWSYVFNMPKYGADGKAIVYSINEETVKSYTKTVNGYNIINSFGTVGPQTGDQSSMWLWLVILIIGTIGLRLSVFYRKNGGLKK